MRGFVLIVEQVMKHLSRKQIFAVAVVGFIIMAVVFLYSCRYRFYQYFPAREYREFVVDDGLLVERGSKTAYSGFVRDQTQDEMIVRRYKNGLPDGAGVIYRKGLIAEVGHWQQGLRNGKFMLFSDNGTLLETAEFAADKRNGASREYFADGSLRVKGGYLNDRKHGEWKQFDEKGRPLLSQTYQNGVLDGVSRQYYPSGRVYLHMSYQQGIPAGYYVMYAEDGTPIVEAYLKNGHFEAVKQYNPNYQLPDRDQNGGIVIRKLQTDTSAEAAQMPKLQ